MYSISNQYCDDLLLSLLAVQLHARIACTIGSVGPVAIPWYSRLVPPFLVHTTWYYNPLYIKVLLRYFLAFLA